MKIAVFGTGGMGAFFGGKLALAGNDVHFIARGAHLAAMRERGLTVTSPNGDFTVTPVQATDKPDQIGAVDIVLFCVKLYDVESAGAALGTLLSRDTSYVVTFQNGVEVADMLAPLIGKERILPGAAYVSANIVQPGVIGHVGSPGYMDFGELDGKLSDRAQQFIDCCAGAGFEARFQPDIMASLWSKFVLVAAFSGVMGLARAPLGIVRADTDARGLLEAALNEAEQVGRALGVTLPEHTAQSIFQMANALPHELKPSLLEDLEHGRRLEVEWLSGGVRRLGRQVGVATPVHDVIYSVLKLHADGQ
ncbi:MAG TPA: 2-dehydropantoate 2-reductase [Alphaproteobacteria bacterium]|jgi:2-dehydropantoate 2-reductase|nr:2-dehydropantoate 2-reductase [Alphaproteobacteria bacterium]